jgi:hypothetical protein
LELPTIAGTTGMQHHTQIFSMETGSHEVVLAGLAWNHDPPDLNLPSS